MNRVKLLLFLVILSQISFAATITSTQSGNFNTTTTWTGGVVPGINDLAEVIHNVTLFQNQTVSALRIQSTGRLSGGGFEVAVSGGGTDLGANIIFQHDGVINGSFDLRVNKTTGASLIGLTGGGNPSVRNLTITTGTQISTVRFNSDVNGNLIVTSGALDIGANTLTVTGTSSITGNLTFTTGSYVSNGAVTVNAGGVLGSNSSWTFDQNSPITIGTSSTFNAPNASGMWNSSSSITGAGVMTFNHDKGTIIVDGYTLINLQGGNWKFYDIAVIGVGTLLQMYQGSYTIEHSLNVTPGSATFQFQNRDGAGASTVTLGTATQAATVIATGTINLATGSGASTPLTIAAASYSFPWIMTGGGLAPGSSTGSTVNLRDGIISTFTLSAGGNQIFNMTNMTFNGAVTLSGNTLLFNGFNNINNTFTTSAGSFAIINPNAVLTLNGTTTINGSLIPLSNSILTSNTGTGAITINSGGVLGNNTDYNLTINGAIINNGMFNAPNSTGLFNFGNLSSTYSLDGNGTFNDNNGTLTLIGTSTDLNFLISSNQTWTFNNINHTATRASWGVIDNGNFIVKNNFIIGSSSFWAHFASTKNNTIIIGTSTSPGLMAVNGRFGPAVDSGHSGPYYTTIQSASSTYRSTVTGNNWDWRLANYVDQGRVILKDLIFNSSITTDQSYGAKLAGITIEPTSNMTFNGAIIVSSGDTLGYGQGNIFHNSAVTINNGAYLNSSFSNIIYVGAFSSSGNISTLNDSTINTLSSFSVAGGGNFTLTNVTFTNNTPSVSGSANLTAKWRNIKVVDETGAALSGALVNITQGGSTLGTVTTGSDGILQVLVTDYENIGGTLSFRTANISASKSGYQANSVLDNVSINNFVSALAPSGGGQSGFTTGYSVIGTPVSATTTTSVKVNSLAISGPWRNVQNVTILDSSSTVIANFTHNFSEGSLPISHLRINTGPNWIGINGRLLATLGHFNKTFTFQVPIKDAVCNTQACIGFDKLSDSDCSTSDWSTYQSTKFGSFCMASVASTVIRDQSDLTSIVSVPELDFIWVLVIFVIAFAIFRARL